MANKWKNALLRVVKMVFLENGVFAAKNQETLRGPEIHG